jgi:predicted DNA-binding mobile mystery protein A
MNMKMLTVWQLDKILKKLNGVNKKCGMPESGWIKTLRKTLAMPVEQLSQRLGVNLARVYKIEKAEMEGAITMRTLRKVADALGCEVVYCMVPKNNATLKSIIMKNIDSRIKHLRKGKKYKAAYLDSLDMLYGSQGEIRNETDATRDRNEPASTGERCNESKKG